MITVITGLTGSGKTFLMSRLAYNRAKKKEIVYPNLAFTFGKHQDYIKRWHSLSETFNLRNGVICIDEGQKLFDAHNWAFLPMTFSEKIASHRHQGLDIITTTQDFGHIDIRVRQNVHERYHCRSIIRLPKNDRKEPIIQVVRITKNKRSFDDTGSSIKWENAGAGKIFFISKFFTKRLYNTYANIDLSHFLCQIKRDKKKWVITLKSRQLSNNSARSL